MDPYHAIQNYGRFKKAINTAAVLSKTIDGNTGDLIVGVVDSLSELARSFHRDWDGSWAPKDDTNLKKQQNNALFSFREIIKSISCIIDIYQHRRKEQQLRGPQQTTISPSAPYRVEEAPSTSHAASPLMNGNEVGPALDEIKEELMEVKEEPLDEPLFDTYCPTTGTSRSVVKEVKEEEPDDLEPQASTSSGAQFDEQASSSTTNGKRFFKVQGCVFRTNAADSEKQQTKTLLDDQTAAWAIEPINSFKEFGFAQWKKCYLCNDHIHTYYKLPEHYGTRQAFLNRVLKLDRPIRTRISNMELKNGDADAYFCVKHIAPGSNADKTEDISTPTAKKVLTLKEVDVARVVIRKEPVIARIDGGVRKNGQRTRCELCGSPAFPFTLSPKDPAAAERFFNKLTNITKVQLGKLQYYVQHGRQWNVCRRHFPPATLITKSSSKTSLPVLPISGKKYIPIVPGGAYRIGAPRVVQQSAFAPTTIREVQNKQRMTCEVERLASECDYLLRTVQQHTDDDVIDNDVDDIVQEELFEDVKEEQMDGDFM